MVIKLDLRFTFNEVPGEYDKWRPGYVPELYVDIENYSRLDQESKVLEIGIGTGQATQPILNTKCSLTAVELGADLAVYTKYKFRDFNNFRIENTSFEDYECSDNTFDLVYSASAFHWIPEEIGYRKVHRLLKSGGTFARFANHPYRDKENDALHESVQEVYTKYMPGNVLPPEHTKEDSKKNAETAKRYGFSDVRYTLYHRKRAYDAQNYAALSVLIPITGPWAKRRWIYLQRK